MLLQFNQFQMQKLEQKKLSNARRNIARLKSTFEEIPPLSSSIVSRQDNQLVVMERLRLQRLQLAPDSISPSVFPEARRATTSQRSRQPTLENRRKLVFSQVPPRNAHSSLQSSITRFKEQQDSLQSTNQTNDRSLTKSKEALQKILQRKGKETVDLNQLNTKDISILLTKIKGTGMRHATPTPSQGNTNVKIQTILTDIAKNSQAQSRHISNQHDTNSQTGWFDQTMSKMYDTQRADSQPRKSENFITDRGIDFLKDSLINEREVAQTPKLQVSITPVVTTNLKQLHVADKRAKSQCASVYHRPKIVQNQVINESSYRPNYFQHVIQNENSLQNPIPPPAHQKLPKREIKVITKDTEQDEIEVQKPLHPLIEMHQKQVRHQMIDYYFQKPKKERKVEQRAISEKKTETERPATPEPEKITQTQFAMQAREKRRISQAKRKELTDYYKKVDKAKLERTKSIAVKGPEYDVGAFDPETSPEVKNIWKRREQRGITKIIDAAQTSLDGLDIDDDERRHQKEILFALMRILLKRWRNHFGEDLNASWYGSLTHVLEMDVAHLAGRNKPSSEFIKMNPEQTQTVGYEVREDCIKLFHNFIEAATENDKNQTFQKTMRSMSMSIRKRVQMEKVKVQAKKLMKQFTLSNKILLNIGEKELIRKFGHFRFLVAKHFLSKPLQQIFDESRETGTFKLRMIARLQLFDRVMEETFPRNDAFAKNLGLKMQQILQDEGTSSLYKNEYIIKAESHAKLFSKCKPSLAKVTRMMDNQLYLSDMNVLFGELTSRKNFFKIIKSPHVLDETSDEAIMMDFASKIKHEVLNPHFYSIFNHTVMLLDLTLSEKVAQAINQYQMEIQKTERSNLNSYQGSYRIDTIVLDSCVWNDNSCAKLLKNCKSHAYLDSLNIFNCKFGAQSLKELVEIMPTITELRLSNLQGLRPYQIENLIGSIAHQGRHLQVLKLNHLQLGSKHAMEAICDFIETNPFINLLDLANTSLRANHLWTIVTKLIEFPDSIKSLNLADNLLIGGQDYVVEIEDELDVKIQYQTRNYTTEFFKVMRDYLHKSCIINHLDLSGLQIMEIVRQLNVKKCSGHISKGDESHDHHKHDEHSHKNESNDQDFHEAKFSKFQSKSGQAHHCITDYQKKIQQIQTSSIWHCLMDLLFAINDAKFLLSVHLSNNGLRNHLQESILHFHGYRADTMTVEDLPDYALSQDIFDCFEIDARGIATSSVSAARSRRIDCAKLLAHQAKGMIPDYAKGIRKLHQRQRQDQLDREITKEKFNQDANPEPIRNYNVFMAENEGQFTRYSKIRGKLQTQLYDLELEQRLKYVQQNKTLNNSKLDGFARTERNKMNDDFILSRPSASCIELIFSRRHRMDRYFHGSFQRYYQPEQPLKWELADKDTGCIVCQKYTFTMIFFNQADLDDNKDLIEVKDKDQLDMIRKDFWNSCGNIPTASSPQICGSVVATDPMLKAGSKGLSVFSRKLLMMRGDIFTLLSISHKKSMVATEKQSDGIRKGALFTLELEHNQSQHTELYQKQAHRVEDKLVGWQQILHQRCTDSELVSAKKINYLQAISQETLPYSQSKGIYVYAANLKPGLHQFVIYDPKSRRAFCKEVVIDLNRQFIECPELPVSISNDVGSTTKNVWLPWKHDTVDQMAKAVEWDRMSGNFDLELFIRDKMVNKKHDPAESRNQILKQLVSCFPSINIIQKTAMANSKTFPEIDYSNFLSLVEKLEKTAAPYTPEIDPTQKKGDHRIDTKKSKLELVFIRATRNDQTQGLASCLCRSELLEALVRLAMQYFPVTAAKNPTAAMGEFVNKLMRPFSAESEIPRMRQIIHSDQGVNDLLYDNRRLMKAFYLYWKDPMRGFTVRSTFLYLCYNGTLEQSSEITQNDMEQVVQDEETVFAKLGSLSAEGKINNPRINFLINKSTINEVFLFSQMSIINEVVNFEKYYYLTYVEFLEMTCRVALKCKLPSPTNSPCSKLKELLHYLLKKMQAENILMFENFEIINIDRNPHMHANFDISKLEKNLEDGQKSETSDVGTDSVQSSEEKTQGCNK